MPIYEYDCGHCGEDYEVIQKISESPRRKCPSCGSSKLRRRVSLSAFQLKGNGWYATDYASTGAKKAESSTPGATATASESTAA